MGPTSKMSFSETLEEDFADASKNLRGCARLLFDSMHGQIEDMVRWNNCQSVGTMKLRVILEMLNAVRLIIYRAWAIINGKKVPISYC